MDQHRIRAGLGIGGAALQRLRLPQPCDQRLGPRDHQRAADDAGGFDLALELLDRDQFLPAADAQRGILGEGLVLHHHRGDAGRGIARHQIGDRDRIAAAGVDVGDDRGVLHLDHRTHGGQMRVPGQDGRIRHRMGGGQLEAAAPDGVEAGLGGEFRGERVVRRHGDGRLVGGEAGAKPGAGRFHAAMLHRRGDGIKPDNRVAGVGIAPQRG